MKFNIGDRVITLEGSWAFYSADCIGTVLDFDGQYYYVKFDLGQRVDYFGGCWYVEPEHLKDYNA